MWSTRVGLRRGLGGREGGLYAKRQLREGRGDPRTKQNGPAQVLAVAAAKSCVCLGRVHQYHKYELRLLGCGRAHARHINRPRKQRFYSGL